MHDRLAEVPKVAGLLDRATPGVARPGRHDLESLIGPGAWQQLPRAVRRRFGEPALAVDYHGTFEIVRASRTGRILALLCRALGTPVTPRTGYGVPAVVQVRPTQRGVQWQREYRWPDHGCSRICSTKIIGTDGVLVEKLPAGLCMPLQVFERGGSLHFVSRGYYFEVTITGKLTLRVPLPAWLSPGVTHVEHTDEADGWFRFTMTVEHPLLGEVFFQTVRFRAAGGSHDAGL